MKTLLNIALTTCFVLGVAPTILLLLIFVIDKDYAIEYSIVIGGLICCLIAILIVSTILLTAF